LSIGSQARFRMAPDVHARRFGDELVLLDLGRGEYFSLNAVGSEIWETLLGGCTLEEAVEQLRSRYDVDVGVLRDDLAALADELVRRSLLLAE
jgi:Coenzyme PQQ synthesis protein D (PqqD)